MVQNPIPSQIIKKGMFEEIVLIQFWSGGTAPTHRSGAEYEARIPIGRFTRYRSMINHFCCFLDSRSAKNPKPNSAITLNFVNLYNTTGYAYKEEDWNV